MTAKELERRVEALERRYEALFPIFDAIEKIFAAQIEARRESNSLRQSAIEHLLRIAVPIAAGRRATESYDPDERHTATPNELAMCALEDAEALISAAEASVDRDFASMFKTVDQILSPIVVDTEDRT